MFNHRGHRAMHKKKIWTNYEIRNIISRAIEQNEEYILPVRFDDTEIEGIRPTLAFVDLRKKTPEQFVNLILKKLGNPNTIPISERFQEHVEGVLMATIYHAFITNSFGIQPQGPTINVTITNKLSGDYRYFYESNFRVTKPIREEETGFHLTNILNPTRFPIKLEYGEVFEINYELNISQRKLWEQFEEDCEFYAVCSTTIGEKFESSKNKVKSIIDSFDMFK